MLNDSYVPTFYQRKINRKGKYKVYWKLLTIIPDMPLILKEVKGQLYTIPKEEAEKIYFNLTSW